MSRLARLFPARQPDPLVDVVLLLARVVVGVVFIAHGLQKLDQGHAATAAGFEAMGIPLAEVAAAYAIAAEIGGGALLLAGLLSPLAGVVIALTMAGAFWFAHRGTAVLSQEGGWEMVAVYAVAALVLGAMPGRLSVDHALFGRRSQATA